VDKWPINNSKNPLLLRLLLLGGELGGKFNGLFAFRVFLSSNHGDTAENSDYLLPVCFDESAKQDVLFVFGKDVLEEGFAFGNILGQSWQNLIENWMTEELQHNIHRRCLA
jgi:hypothetical protein